ncbi:MAG: hypothetical protein HY064_07100 [Bacteroidetes bacterium]|nr:hypothetical protein [Bacteroidota bacterium]
MKTLVINVDNDSSARLLIELAKKLHFKTRILSDEKKEDVGLISMMMERESDELIPVSRSLDILKKIR